MKKGAAAAAAAAIHGGSLQLQWQQWPASRKGHQGAPLLTTPSYHSCWCALNECRMEVMGGASRGDAIPIDANQHVYRVLISLEPCLREFLQEREGEKGKECP